MSEHRNPLERVLGLFTEVRAGEGATAVLLTVNIFLILTAYYIIKPVREGLILAVEHGAELKAYAAAGQGLLLLGAVPVYAWLASRVPRRRLINLVTLFFVSNLVLFYFAVRMTAGASQVLGIGFFLWVGVFNLMVPAQFWSFANDVYTVDQGKRLFAIVAFGASAGAVVGSWITDQNIESVGLGNLLLLSGGILVAALLLTGLVESREGRARRADPNREEEEPLPEGGAFGLVLRNRYLLLIGLLMLFLNWVNTTGEYILGDTVKAAIEARALEQGIADELRAQWVSENIGAFYAAFFTVVNIVGLLLQLFVVSRILKYLGVRVALMVLPCIALGGYAILAMIPMLNIVRWAKTAENATDYSLQNTVRQALFLPTTREQKYKAKQAIDTVFVRAGDVLSALLVYVGVNVFALRTRQFALVNLGLVAVWLVLALRIGREYRKLTAGQA
jgi:AAA family ATP:ADP antiporter